MPSHPACATASRATGRSSPRPPRCAGIGPSRWLLVAGIVVVVAFAVVVAAVAALAWAIHVGVERPLGKRLRRLLDTPRLEARMSSVG